MRKILKCGEIVPGCNFVAHGDDESDVMMRVADHARSVHGVDHMSEQLRTKVKSAIRDEVPA
jgi:predicted small metal-binding protein